jgi:hypothetical protein
MVVPIGAFELLAEGASLPGLVPESARRAPCRASAWLIAEPMPPAAPVTSAVMPVRSKRRFSIHFAPNERGTSPGPAAPDNHRPLASASMSAMVITLVTARSAPPSG